MSLTPSHVRELARGDFSLPSTSGLCDGFEQANLVVVEEDYASQFLEFCRLNPAPCPVLYSSKPGEVGAPALATDSDVRTDIPFYKVYKRGESAQRVSSLLDEPWERNVSFYLGCSFGLEHALQKRSVPVRHIEQNVNVPMFKTNVPCHASGPFHGPLVVSMRPMPADCIKNAVLASRSLPRCHGTPVHIGCPSWIGIEHVEKPDFGEAVTLHDGDIPVFWACGVTSGVALGFADLEKSYSHSPGFMFVSDLPSEPAVADDQMSDGLLQGGHDIIDGDHHETGDVEIVCITPERAPKMHSLLLSSHATKIAQLESLIVEDPGGRGVGHLQQPGSLLRSALCLSHSKRVAIMTGFPCVPDHPFDETDGLPGCLAVARALQACEQEVVLLCDQARQSLYSRCVQECVDKGWLWGPVNVLTSTESDESNVGDLVAEFDHLVAIERASPSRSDGKHYTMTARDISDHCSPLSLWFTAALKSEVTTTTGVGDGGNEVGMGNVYKEVVQFIKNGEKIASSVCADNLVVAGVSNWGGYALAAALYIVRSCQVHSRYLRHGIGLFVAPQVEKFLPSEDNEKAILEFMNSVGFRDGINPSLKLSVDGLTFYPHHANKLYEIRRVALS